LPAQPGRKKPDEASKRSPDECSEGALIATLFHGRCAGTLCHGVSHTIHRDTVTLMQKQQGLERREVGAAILLGSTGAHLLAILLLGKLHSLSYSRDLESTADITDSDVCAATGYNPRGLVWLFQDFANANGD
jgi:beta-barrel assembly-enhancing protease